MISSLSLLDSATVPRFGDRHVLSDHAVVNGAVGMDVLPDGRVISFKRVATEDVSKQVESAEQTLLGSVVLSAPLAAQASRQRPSTLVYCR